MPALRKRKTASRPAPPPTASRPGRWLVSHAPGMVRLALLPETGNTPLLVYTGPAGQLASLATDILVAARLAQTPPPPAKD